MIGRRVTFCAVVLWAAASPALATSLLADPLDLTTNWHSLGNVSIDANAIPSPSTIPVGTRLLFSTGNTNNQQPDATAFDTLQSQIALDALADPGHSDFDSGGATEGSMAWQSFTAQAGDVLSLSFDFLTIEGSAYFAASNNTSWQNGPGRYIDDYAFLALQHAGIVEYFRIADILSPLMQSFDDPDDRFEYHTGFHTFTLPAPLANGTYTLYLGVLDGASAPPVPDYNKWMGESALLVESINVESPAAVPAPTAAPAGLALLAIAAVLRRLRRA